MFRTTYELTSRAPIQSADPSYDPNESYGCDLCSEGGWCSETEVEIHRKTKHTKALNALIRDVTKNPCKICVTPHENAEELLKHIKTVHLLSSEDAYRVEREIFTCNYCSQIFFNKQQLAVHIVYTHIDKEGGVANCPRCFKNVRVKSMWFHYERHNIQSVSSCKICLDKCKNRKHLKEHMKTHLSYHKCEMCGYMAKKLASFKQHILSLHKGDAKETKEGKYKKYFIPQVDHWNRKTQSTSALKGLHLHDFVRICILCREICTSLTAMKHHILVEHTKFKIPKNVYICVCGESFSNKVLFKHHTFKMKGEDHVLLGSSEQDSDDFDKKEEIEQEISNDIQEQSITPVAERQEKEEGQLLRKDFVEEYAELRETELHNKNLHNNFRSDYDFRREKKKWDERQDILDTVETERNKKNTYRNQPTHKKIRHEVENVNWDKITTKKNPTSKFNKKKKTFIEPEHNIKSIYNRPKNEHIKRDFHSYGRTSIPIVGKRGIYDEK